MAATIPQDRLAMAAHSVHRVLKSHHLKHQFFGGYEIVLLGSARGTKDVDVVVKKPFLYGFDKVKKAFQEDPEFIVLDGKRTDGIRAIYNVDDVSVGIDIMFQDLPKGLILMNVDSKMLPFFTITHMFLKKIWYLTKRDKAADQNDIIYLHDNHLLQIDMVKVKREVTTKQITEILAMPHIEEKVVDILTSLIIE